MSFVTRATIAAVVRTKSSSSTLFHLLLSFKVKCEVALSVVGHVEMFPPRASKRSPAAPRQPLKTVERAAQAARGRLSDSLCFAWSQDINCYYQTVIHVPCNHAFDTTIPLLPCIPTTSLQKQALSVRSHSTNSLVLFLLFKFRVGESSSSVFLLWWRQDASFHAARRAGGQGKGKAQSRSHGIAALRGEGPNGRDAETSVGLESAESFIFF